MRTEYRSHHALLQVHDSATSKLDAAASDSDISDSEATASQGSCEGAIESASVPPNTPPAPSYRAGDTVATRGLQYALCIARHLWPSGMVPVALLERIVMLLDAQYLCIYRCVYRANCAQCCAALTQGVDVCTATCCTLFSFRVNARQTASRYLHRTCSQDWRGEQARPPVVRVPRLMRQPVRRLRAKPQEAREAGGAAAKPQAARGASSTILSGAAENPLRA